MKNNELDVYNEIEDFQEKEEQLAMDYMENVESEELEANLKADKTNAEQMRKKQYEMYRAEQFINKMLEDSRVKERYAILLKNYYKAGIKMHIPYVIDCFIVGALGSTAAFFSANNTPVGCTCCSIVGGVWLIASIKNYIKQKMYDAIDKGAQTAKKQQLGVEYLNSKEDSKEYLGRLSFLQYKKVLKSINKNGNLDALMQSYEQKVAKADADQKLREKKWALNNILTKNKSFNIESDSEKEEELLSK